jgi:thiol-disulfide isomerase/thioredoxin
VKRLRGNRHLRACEHRRRLSLFAVAALILAALQTPIVDTATAKSANAVFNSQSTPMAYQTTHLSVEGQLPSFGKGVDWLNSKPLAPADLRGRVVLIEFWTYSCINWRRQLPYVRAWSQRYKAQGLIVIGVHSPEFSFEKNLENVRQGVKDTRVNFPVVIDNDHAIWRAFNNEAWPALYFVDAKGRIRHHLFGEGEYRQSELILQQLLQEAGAGEPDHKVVKLDPMDAEAVADWNDLRTPETYVGYDRTENFASPGGAKRDKSRDYTAPVQLQLNHWALSGDWKVGREAVALNDPGGRIVYQFHARDLHLVMGPAAPGARVRFRVLIDGQSPGAAHGVDVDEQGNGTVTEPRMYQLIRQQKPITDRKFEIEFLDPGVEAFSFTFG